jgi:hypothetical protein
MFRSITLLLIAIVAVSADSPAALFVRAANNAAALVGAPATDASNAGVAPVANADVAAVDGASQPLRRLLAKRGECTSSFDFGSQKGSCKSLDDCPKDFGTWWRVCSAIRARRTQHIAHCIIGIARLTLRVRSHHKSIPCVQASRFASGWQGREGASYCRHSTA